MIRSVIIATCLLSASSAFAATLDGRSLSPYTNAWHLSFVKDGKATEAGTVTDELTFVEIDGRKLMKRTQIVKYTSGAFELRDENTFDPATMAPVTMDFWKNGQLVNHREFDGRFVYFHAPGTPMKIVQYSDPVFDFYGGMYGLLIRALPLQAGYSTTLPAVDEDSQEFREVTVHVLRKDPVNAGPGGQIEAWLAEAETSLGAMRFWIVTSPPYIIRLEWTPDPE